MKLEEQVTSYGLSEALKKLGVPQESYFVWRHWRSNGALGVYKKQDKWFDYPRARGMKPQTTFNCSAFTTAELGENKLYQDYECHTARVYIGADKRWLCVSNTLRNVAESRQYGATEAEARGLMVAYLIRNHTVTAS